MKNPGQLADEIYKSKALSIERRFGVLGKNYYVFKTNYRALKEFMTREQTPDQIFGQKDIDPILYELTRLLHNFLASAKMLVELTRNVMKDWYSGTALHDEYNQEIKSRFALNKVSGFIEDLRNYALHFELPIAAAHLNVTRDPSTGAVLEDAAFILQKSTLRKWRKWSKGKPYLQESSENISIEILSDQYFETIQGLHQWISKRLAKEHTNELAWLENKRSEYRQALQEAGLPVPTKE